MELTILKVTGPSTKQQFHIMGEVKEDGENIGWITLSPEQYDSLFTILSDEVSKRYKNMMSNGLYAVAHRLSRESIRKGDFRVSKIE